jgi:hypothetical protein
MIKSPIRVVENIGSYCHETNGRLVLGEILDGYAGLSINHNNTYIPYICKSFDLKNWEIGIGLVLVVDSKVVVERIQIIKKSSENYQFVGNNNLFYVFANEYNFNTGLNNCVILEATTELSNIKCTYVKNNDSNNQYDLPSSSNNQGLTLEFKNSSDSRLNLHNTNNGEIYSCDPGEYIKLISDGKSWIKLYSVMDSLGVVSLSTEDQSNYFGTQSHVEASGIYGSIQYNNNGSFDGSSLVISSGLLLLGSNSTNPSSAQNIIPLSLSNNDTVFNNTNSSGNFVVKGLGDKNLIFTKDGRLGLNIPSGSLPQTALHVLSYACQEGIRLENRNSCYPANLTLYHKPSTLPSNGSIVSTINLSSKNSANAQVNYAQLRSKIVNSDSVSSSGEFAIAIQNNGSLVEALRINPTGLVASVGNNSIIISNSSIQLNGALRSNQVAASGSFMMSDGSGNLILTSINNSPIISLLDGGIVTFTGVCS